METKSLENPLIQVLKLVVADPKLRRKFIYDPAAVFKQVGLGCPLNFVGRQGNFCPVMPKLPEDESAATDIGHPYWQEWLQGGVDQLGEFRRVLGSKDRYPDRSSFHSEDEWEHFFRSVVHSISQTMKHLHEEDSQ